MTRSSKLLVHGLFLIICCIHGAYSHEEQDLCALLGLFENGKPGSHHGGNSGNVNHGSQHQGGDSGDVNHGSQHQGGDNGNVNHGSQQQHQGEDSEFVNHGSQHQGGDNGNVNHGSQHQGGDSGSVNHGSQHQGGEMENSNQQGEASGNNNNNNNSGEVTGNGYFQNYVPDEPLPEPAEKEKPTKNNEVRNCECIPSYLCSSLNANTSDNPDGIGLIDIRFGEGDPQCPSYLETCCAKADQQPVEKVTPKPQPDKVWGCGNRQPNGVNFRIIGASDNEANYGEFPWMVAVLRRDHVHGSKYLKVMECGGSIIHPRVVLTGAHCVKGKTNLYVRAGEWDSQTDKEVYPVQDRNVTEVIIHEEFYGGALHNDVALLILESPLQLSAVVGTICLPLADENMDGRACVVTGWGKDNFGREGKYQVILKRVDQPVIPHEPCQVELRKTRLGARFRLHQSFICAGGQVGKDACKGDGGGPLVCPSVENPDVYVQAGIVAWGIGCGTTTPAVYASVPHARHWIDGKLRALNIS